MAELWRHIQHWLIQGGVALIILVAGLFVVAIIVQGLRRIFSRTSFNETVEDFIANFANIAGRILVILVALSYLGVDLAPILAGLGVLGFVVGFALKDTLSNLASGLMILFYRPFEKGDEVSLLGGKVMGIVEAVDIPATLIRNSEGELFLVPNSKIWGDVIVNRSRKERENTDHE